MFGENEICTIIKSIKVALSKAVTRDEKRELQAELAYYTRELQEYSMEYPACSC